MADEQDTAVQTAEAPEAQAVDAQSGFGSSMGWDLMQRQSQALAASTLVPKDFQNNLPNCIIALEMAQRTGASPLMVMQNLYVVHGRPSWSAQFLIATWNKCGRFTPIQYTFEGEENTDQWGCRAQSTDKATGEEIVGPLITIALSKAEGWYARSGSKWQTMPEQMLRYRSASWLIRTQAPEISMGLYSSDELADSGRAVEEASYEVVDTPSLNARIAAMKGDQNEGGNTGTKEGSPEIPPASQSDDTSDGTEDDAPADDATTAGTETSEPEAEETAEETADATDTELAEKAKAKKSERDTLKEEARALIDRMLELELLTKINWADGIKWLGSRVTTKKIEEKVALWKVKIEEAEGDASDDPTTSADHWFWPTFNENATEGDTTIGADTVEHLEEYFGGKGGAVADLHERMENPMPPDVPRDEFPIDELSALIVWIDDKVSKML